MPLVPVDARRRRAQPGRILAWLPSSRRENDGPWVVSGYNVGALVGAPFVGLEDVASVEVVSQAQNPLRAVRLRLTPDGTKRLAEASARLREKPVTVIVDGEVASTFVFGATLADGSLSFAAVGPRDPESRSRRTEELGARLQALLAGRGAARSSPP